MTHNIGEVPVVATKVKKEVCGFTSIKQFYQMYRASVGDWYLEEFLSRCREANVKPRLSLFEKSMKSGHLRSDWDRRVREGYEITVSSSGYICATNDLVQTFSGKRFHYREDKALFITNSYDHCIEKGHEVRALGHNTEEDWFDKTQVVEYEGKFYFKHRDALRANGLCELADGELFPYDEAVLCDDNRKYYRIGDARVHEWSDGSIHFTHNVEPVYDDVDRDRDKLFQYHSGRKPKFFVGKDPAGELEGFGIGFEIEKSEMPTFQFSKYRVQQLHGAILEQDGSVSAGFELQTPIYDLFSPKTFERLEGLRGFIEVPGVQGAGGHVGYSKKGMRDIDLLNSIEGFLPLVYALYKPRLTNTYCTAKKKSKLERDNDSCRYQSIRLRGAYLEFRVVASVKNWTSIAFRIELFRIMSLNLNKPFNEVLQMALTEGTRLNNLLRQDIYKDPKKFTRLINDCVVFDKEFSEMPTSDDIVSRILPMLPKVEVEVPAPVEDLSVGVVDEIISAPAVPEMPHFNADLLNGGWATGRAIADDDQADLDYFEIPTVTARVSRINDLIFHTRCTNREARLTFLRGIMTSLRFAQVRLRTEFSAHIDVIVSRETYRLVFHDETFLSDTLSRLSREISAQENQLSIF
jgi:hypothetical protein